MKKLIPTILIFTLVLFAVPNRSYAAWWSPVSWFSKDQQATSTDTISITSPADNPQNAYAQTIEELRAEVAILKASLDSLYTAHNNLVEDHNALLKYVNATASSGKGVGTATNNSNLETKITSLDKKLDDVCSHIFSSLGGFGSKCPSSQFNLTGTLESRIKKLESGI